MHQNVSSLREESSAGRSVVEFQAFLEMNDCRAPEGQLTSHSRNPQVRVEKLQRPP
jgi:hypothetical protein